MRKLLQLITNLDAKAWRTIALSFLLFGGVGFVFVFGASLLGVNGAQSVERWMGAGVSGPWAPLLAVGGFTLLAFLGAPQFVLIAAAVVAFGPGLGVLYSWLGTEVSAIVGFWFGRRFGARLLQAYAGKGVRQFTDLVAKNGLLASLVVRLVPSAPFIVVNMAAGATGMGLLRFAVGTGVGIIPKIVLTAFAGRAVVSAVGGHGKGGWLSLVGAAAIWVAAGLAARAWLKRQEALAATDSPDAGGSC